MLDLVAGLVAGFGAAAALTLRRDPDVHSLRARGIAVVAAGAYLVLLLLLASVVPVVGRFALVSGAVIPWPWSASPTTSPSGRASRGTSPRGDQPTGTPAAEGRTGTRGVRSVGTNT